MWRGGESPVRSGARSKPVKRPSRARPPPSRLPQAAVLTTTRIDQLAQSKLVGKPLAALDQSLGQWRACDKRPGRLSQWSPVCVRSVKGGPDIPAIHDGCSDFARSRGCRHIAGSTTPRAGGVGTARFTSLAPLRGHAARGFSVHRIRPWPQRRSLRGWSTVFLKPQFRAQAERTGFPTATDHVQRRLGRAC